MYDSVLSRSHIWVMHSSYIWLVVWLYSSHIPGIFSVQLDYI